MRDFLKMAHNELWEFLSVQDNPLKNYLRLQKKEPMFTWSALKILRSF